VKGIYCEKPISTSMGAAFRMKAACEKHGSRLFIGHQRRVSSVYRAMKRIIDEGVIGEIYLIRGSCAGDFLSDGTHTIDSMMFLTGDRDVKWLLSQIYRGRKATLDELAVNRFKYCGARYGHNVEEGAMVVIELDNGVRLEAQTGTMWIPERGYQDIEVFGTKGRIWRAGDSADPPIRINTDGIWKPFGHDITDDSLENAHEGIAEAILTGSRHPMDIETAIKGFELVMAVYESARLNARLEMPLKQMEYPLDVMLRDGQID